MYFTLCPPPAPPQWNLFGYATATLSTITATLNPSSSAFFTIPPSTGPGRELISVTNRSACLVVYGALRSRPASNKPDGLYTDLLCENVLNPVMPWHPPPIPDAPTPAKGRKGESSCTTGKRGGEG